MINATTAVTPPSPEEPHYPREEQVGLLRSFKLFFKNHPGGKAFVTLFAIAGLAASVSLANTLQLNRAKGLSGGIDVFFSPAAVTIAPNTGNYVYDVFVTTNTLSLSAVDITITNSNPNVVQITGVSPTGATPTLLTKSFTPSSAHIVAAIQNPAAPFSGTTKVATISLSTGSALGSTTLSFINMQLSAPNQTVNGLDEAKSAVITVAAPSSPVPSTVPTTPPAPVASPKPTPTPRQKPASSPKPPASPKIRATPIPKPPGSTRTPSPTSTTNTTIQTQR